MLRLVAAFNLYRKVYDITLAQVCRETGIRASTMTRFGQGKQIYSSELTTILTWLLQEDTRESERPPERGRQHEPHV